MFVMTVPLHTTAHVPSKLSENIAPASVYESFLFIVTVPEPLSVITGMVVSTTFTIRVT